MLVLTRKQDEVFYLTLSDDVDPNMTAKELFSQPIKVTLIEAHRSVRIGVDASNMIKIRRDEPWSDLKRGEREQ